MITIRRTFGGDGVIVERVTAMGETPQKLTMTWEEAQDVGVRMALLGFSNSVTEAIEKHNQQGIRDADGHTS